MSRLSPANVELAHEIISHYPRKKSALIPLLHVAQEQDGYVSEAAMEHLAELVGITPAEVLGTASFYEMFKFEPQGKYMVNICTNISCQLNGGEELLHHAEETLGDPTRWNHSRWAVHPRRRRMHRCVHRSSLSAGQLQIRVPARQRRLRPVDRRSAVRRTVRHPWARDARPGPPTHPRRSTGRDRTARGCRDPVLVLLPFRRLMPEHRTRPRSRRTR